MIVIELGHAFESSEAVASFPVNDHVSDPPPSSTWKASVTRPAANAVGCPRLAGDGEKAFWVPTSTVVALGLS